MAGMVRSKYIRQTSGFTIIEVALVLAIAGLIFLVVFLALPALQRQQRDQARKSNVSKIIAAVMENEANGMPVSSMVNGCDPANAPTNCWLSSQQLSALDTGLTTYLSFIYMPTDTFFNDTVSLYWVSSGMGSNASQLILNPSDIDVFGGAQCQGNKSIIRAIGNEVAVVYALENGSIVCQQA